MRHTVRGRLWFVLWLTCCHPAFGLSLERAGIAPTPAARGLVALAEAELRRYLTDLTGRLPGDRGDPQIVLALRGEPMAIGVNFAALELGPEGYLLDLTPGDPSRLLIAAETPRGLLYGVYGLLGELGIGFYLGGDTYPPAGRPVTLPDDFHQVRRPAFAVRGSLPWYNFLNSPTTWDLGDYQSFFDQMARQRYNLVGFHTYDSEPFVPYEWDGRLVAAEPIVSSLNYGWGTVRGLSTAEFGFGTGDLFDRDPFASAALVPGASREEQIRASQRLLAEALTYARGRGLDVCLGFELTGDPTNPETIARLERRIEAMLTAYPMLTHVWFWQAEALGVHGYDRVEPASQLALLADHWRPLLADLGTEQRIAEGVRMARLADAAYRAAKRLRPELTVVLSGWGGDRWLRFTDYYRALDLLLPKDIVFAALDNIQPPAEPNVSAVYGQIDPARPRWPIPWWESDGGGPRGDQWAPQCNTRPFVDLCRDALAKGCQGLLAIHWRTRGVEEVAAFQAEFAWEPGLTYEAFYERYARRCFGQGAMGEVLRELEDLGPRWTGAPGQAECAPFAWAGPVDPEKVERLIALRNRVAECLAGAGGTARERLAWLVNTADWCLKYDRAAAALRSGSEADRLYHEAAALASQGDHDGARVKAIAAWRLLRDSGLDEAMRTYARTVTSRSELGVLATINVKAYAALLARVEALRALGADEASLPAVPFPAPEPLIVLPTPNGVRPPGEPIAISAAILSDSPVAEAAIVYRTHGERTWRTAPLRPAFRRSWRGEVPGVEVRWPGIELYLEARLADGRLAVAPASRPERGWSLTVATIAPPVPAKAPTPRAPSVADLVGSPGPDGSLVLTWSDHGQAARYEIHHGETTAFAPSATTRLAVVPGPPYVVAPGAGPASGHFAVVAIAADGSTTSLARLDSDWRPPAPPGPVTGLEAAGGVNEVRLRWTPLDERSAYRLHRIDDLGEEVAFDRPPGQAEFIDLHVAPDRTYRYTVAGVDRFGREGARSEVVSARPTSVSREPAFGASFDEDAAARDIDGNRIDPELHGEAKVALGALDTRAGGFVTWPHRPDFDPAPGFTLSLRFRTESVAAMPLLASCGLWLERGWFLQILGGALRWHVGGQSLDAGRIEPGRWYAVTATIGPRQLTLWLDGQRIGTRGLEEIHWRPWEGPLVLAQYSRPEPVYQFRGQIDDVRIYRYEKPPE